MEKKYIATLIYPPDKHMACIKKEFRRRIDAINFLRDTCKSSMWAPLCVSLERKEVLNSLLGPFKVVAFVDKRSRRIEWRDYNA